MTKILIAVAVVLLALVLLSRRQRSQETALRASGVLPPEGAGSDVDVERLMAAGHKIQAIKVYREIHGGGLKEAKEAVERIGRAPR